MIPPLDPATGRLPFQGLGNSAYSCTVSEMEERFAFNGTRRHRLARFVAWLEDLNRLGLEGQIWVTGSYVTMKSAPSDIDVLLLITETDAKKAVGLLKQSNPLWTWQGLTATKPQKAALDRLQPFGGAVDAHYGADRPTVREQWETDWTTEYDKATLAPTGVRMGFLEVER